MATTVGQLEIKMLAGMARLEADMKKGNRIVKKNTDQMSSAAGKLKAALGALGLAFGVRAIGGFIAGLINTQEELAKLSQKLNVSVEDLAGWSHAAALAGSDADVLRKGLTFLAKQLLDASTGLAESVRNFDSLGITIKNSDGELKDLIPTMLEVADVFAASEDSTLKTALAFKLFGRAGVDLIPLLNQGSDAIREQVELGNRLNPITTESAELSERLIDNMLNLELSYKAVFIRITNDLLPIMVAMTDAMWDQKEATLGAETSFDKIKETLKALIVFGSEFIFVWETIGIEIAGILERFAVFGDDAALSRVNAMMRDIFDERKKEHDEFIASIMKGMAEPLPERPKSKGRAAMTAPVIVTATAPTALDPIQKAQEAAVKYLLNLQKAEEFAIDSSHLAKARWEIEHGNLQLADRLTQDLIKDKARERDETLAAIEAEKIILALKEESALQQQEAVQETMRIGEAQKEHDIGERDRLINKWQNEKETIEDQRDEELDLLQELWDKKLISENNFLEMRLRMIMEFDEKRAAAEQRAMTQSEKFTAMSWKTKTATIFTELSGLSAGVATHSRKMFELNKVAGISEAIVSAYTGISRTLGAYPYPFNLVMAGAHGIAAFAQVAAISNTQFQGGGAGAAPSLAGSTPATPVTPVGSSNQPSGQTTIINFKGTTDERAMVRRFAKLLNENTHDGGKVVVN